MVHPFAHCTSTYKDRVSQGSNVIAAIERLSDDTILSIFRSCLLHSTFLEAPLLYAQVLNNLTHVCRRWRNLAFSDPWIWSHLHIHPPSYPRREGTLAVYQDAEARWRCSVEQYLVFTQAWIARSGDLPVTFSLTASIGAENEAGDVLARFSPFSTLVCGLSHRWKSASVTIVTQTREQHEALASNILQLTSQDFPLLEKLELNIYQEGTNGRPASTLTPLSAGLLRGENLRSLRVRVVGPGWQMDALPPNWSTLTEFVYRGHSTLRPFREAAAFKLLKLCRCLKVCDIQLQDEEGCFWGRTLPSEGAFHTGTPLTLPHLETLTIQGNIPSAALADALDLPSLHTLHIPFKDIIRPDDKRRKSLAHWMQRFGPQLREVTFVDSHLSDSAFGEVLGHLRGIRTLNLISQEHPLNFGLQPPADTPSSTPSSRPLRDQTYCPSLRRLTMDMSLGGDTFTEESLVSFIAARRSIHTCQSLLESVAVRFGVPRRLEVREELKKVGVELDELDISITYPVPASACFRTFSLDDP